MVEDFRIPRFVSSMLLHVEKIILLAGVWFYASFGFEIKIGITVFCVLSQLFTYLIKDENKWGYILYDFAMVEIISLVMGITFRNMYVALVALIFYYVKSIFYRDRTIIKIKVYVDCILTLGLYFVKWNIDIITFDAFLTAFVCVSYVIIGVLATQLTNYVNSMIDESVEQEASLDDLLRLVESKVIEAEDANKAKDQFLAGMSHEIRTPINAVLGLDTMILRESSEENILRYARDIQGAGRSLLSIINDILDFSKIESGKMKLSYGEYDFASMINDVVNMIRPKVDEKQLEFIIDVDENIPSRLYGDDIRLKQILINLLGNAVKYTPAGSVSLIINSRLKDGNTEITFEVKDTGIGIKAGDIDKLSEEFVRIEETRNRNIEGSGLGINIVISFLKLMNSKLEVESTYGEGSTFYFTLTQPVLSKEPIGKLSERLQQVDDGEEYVVSFCIPQCKLLVVDDNSMNRNVFINLLRDMQCEIDEADSGMKCLEMIKDIKYDIIFMDHMMPEMDGIETFKHMKEMGDYINSDTPVVVLTANAISGARKEYLAEGFIDYLTKPIDVDKLESVIGELIPDDKKMAAAKNKGIMSKNQTIEIDYPMIDGVDWQSAVQRLKSEELLRDLIEGFLIMAESDMEMLKGMYDKFIETKSDEDLDAYRIKVHSMKTNVATLGAYHVAGLAKYLEYAARDKDIETIKSLMPIFEKQWKILKTSIAEEFAKDSQDLEMEKTAIGDDELVEYLDILETAIEEFDLDRVDAVMEELLEHSYDDEKKGLINELKVQVLNMDSDACVLIINSIKENVG